MLKLSLFFLIATLAYCCAYSPFDDSFEDDSEEDSWVFRMPKLHFEPIVMPEFPKFEPINPEDIKNLKPDGPNSHVQGVSTRQSSNVRWVNGKKVVDEQSADVIVNQNGEVHEIHKSNDGGRGKH